ncbi:phosphoglycolate phosphatase [Mycolicibacter terrae]|uniref:Phosphoglycolate phosphatase n=2 Tax=Mycolicibacter terrae TaxID=1788 RepID=A0AAD1HY28_9MYCO|nr:HAD family phosphatase [Mycolicibacter terrae]BBX22924.1 phosphoglycolate phosphatase [Mycolicibacter terrae]SNV69998.1 hydrolase [Mycolicibacter terrae]
MRAVLCDMDGTLVDSEKLWDVAMDALYDRLGGVLRPEVRAATVGGCAENTMRIVYDDLGLPLDPAAMADSAHWLHDYTAGLFDTGLPWCDGARELLDGLAAAAMPVALVTNTPRALAERALDTIGRHYFAAVVCGDEVDRGKPAPDPYLRAAQLLELDPRWCLAVEDSPTGAAAAEAAGCAVLVAPNAIPVPGGPRRRQVASLAGLAPADLHDIYTDLATPIPTPTPTPHERERACLPADTP